MTFLPDDEFDRGRVALWVVAGLLLVVLSYVAWRYVGTVVLGLFGYYVTRPILDRLDDRIPTRTLAVVVAIVTVTLPVLALVAWTITIAVQELAELAETAAFDQVSALLEPYLDLPLIRQQVEEVVEILLSDPGRIVTLDFGPVLGPLGGLVGALVGSVALVATLALHLFIVLVIIFYLLRDDDRIAAWARETFLTPGGVVDEFLVAVDRDLKNVYFGNILNAFVTGLLGATVYWVTNQFAPPGVPIPEPVLLGLLVGAASLVPVVGMKLVWVPVALGMAADALVGEPEALWFPAVFALVSVVVVDSIPDQLLRPYVSGRTLHVGLVMIAYILGPLLFGWYGIFLGPLVLVVVFEFARIVFPWLVDAERDTSDVPPATETQSGAERAAESEPEATPAEPTAEGGTEEEGETVSTDATERETPDRAPTDDGTDA